MNLYAIPLFQQRLKRNYLFIRENRVFSDFTTQQRQLVESTKPFFYIIFLPRTQSAKIEHSYHTHLFIICFVCISFGKLQEKHS